MQVVKLIFVSQIMANTYQLSCNSYGTCLNDTQLMMKVTFGQGCAENESFVDITQYAICCGPNDGLDDPSTLPRFDTNVCLSRPSVGWKKLPGPGCACNKGKDLRNKIKKNQFLQVISHLAKAIAQINASFEIS